MNFITIFLIIIINFIIQSTILPSLRILGVAPNTGLIIIVLISLLRGKTVGSIVGILIGLLQDIIFSTVIGVNGIIYFFIAYIIGMNEEKLAKDNILIPILLSFFATMFYHLLYYLFMFFLGHSINFYAFFKKIVLLEMLYNGLLSILFYKLFNEIFVVPSIRFGKK
ncbi:MAG: rod shape-determining protein MreD [Tissierellia bacterium]|nr:rod shape-determining protein MreD [Tissierellia bacterium]